VNSRPSKSPAPRSWPVAAAADRRSKTLLPPTPARKRRAAYREFGNQVAPHAALPAQPPNQRPLQALPTQAIVRTYGPPQKRRRSAWLLRLRFAAERPAAQCREHTPHGEMALARCADAISYGGALLANARRSRTRTRRRSNQRRCSISGAPPLLNHCIGEDLVTKDRFCPRLKVRPFHRRFLGSLWHNAPDHPVSVPQLHRLPGLKPGLEATGVPELPHVHRWHSANVTHHVSPRQGALELPAGSPHSAAFPEPAISAQCTH